MDAVQEKIFDSLSNSKKSLIQIISLPRYGKTNLLLQYANFYISIGKQVILVGYGGNRYINTIEKSNLTSLKTKNFAYFNNIDLKDLINVFKAKKFDPDKLVVLIDDLDEIPDTPFIGAPAKKKTFFIDTMNTLLSYSSHVVFTNNCKVNYLNKEKPTVITTIKIPVNYSIILENRLNFDDVELSSMMKKAQRIHKISNLNFD